MELYANLEYNGIYRIKYHLFCIYWRDSYGKKH